MGKHISAFKQFCVSNREAISHKNESEVKEWVVSYSTNVSIDFKQLFSLADKETKGVIWNHILCISALVDPANKAKEILKENIKASSSASSLSGKWR